MHEFFGHEGPADGFDIGPFTGLHKSHNLKSNKKYRGAKPSTAPIFLNKDLEEIGTVPASSKTIFGKLGLTTILLLRKPVGQQVRFDADSYRMVFSRSYIKYRTSLALLIPIIYILYRHFFLYRNGYQHHSHNFTV